jgi:DNA-binding transcriptional LysR family regulator
VADLSSISLGDLQLIADLPRFQSLRSWASRNRISAIAASRIIKRVEQAVGAKLINRSAVGFTMTAAGDAFVKKCIDLLQTASSLSHISDQDPAAEFKRTLTFATRGFLNVAIAGQLSQVAIAASRTEGIRFVDLSPDETTDAMRVGALDMVLSLGELSVTKEWTSSKIGTVEWALFARKNHPLILSKNPSLDIPSYRIGHHAYWNGKRVINNQGVTHSSTGQTHNGFGAETAFTALSVCAETDQLAFSPKIAAKQWVEMDLVQEVPMQFSSAIHLQAVLYVAVARVKKPLYLAIQNELRKILKSF